MTDRKVLFFLWKTIIYHQFFLSPSMTHFGLMTLWEDVQCEAKGTREPIAFWVLDRIRARNYGIPVKGRKIAGPNDGQFVARTSFAEIASRVIRMPASEATCERIVSVMRKIMIPHGERREDDLLRACLWYVCIINFIPKKIWCQRKCRCDRVTKQQFVEIKETKG
jgi:hypothetical protein